MFFFGLYSCYYYLDYSSAAGGTIEEDAVDVEEEEEEEDVGKHDRITLSTVIPLSHASLLSLLKLFSISTTTS